MTGRKHLPRRTFLRAAGATLALPWLDAMIPARIAAAQATTSHPQRFVAIFYPHGMAPGYWVPEQVGPLPAVFPEDSMHILKSLEPFREKLVVLSGLWAKASEPPEGKTGSDHFVAASFLTAHKPRKTAGSDISVGSPTIDQTIARKISADTPVDSLQLAVEDPNHSSGNCGEGYSCWYTNSISWRTANQPLRMELDPRVVFETLFGSGTTTTERQHRRQRNLSVLDGLVGEITRLKSNVGPSDRQVMDRYTDEIRAAETQIQRAERIASRLPGLNAPTGEPLPYDDHVRLYYDLLALGFQADITRVATMMGAREYSGIAFPLPKNELFPEGGRSGSFHGLSRHQENARNKRDFAKLNRYHVSTMAYLASRLNSMPEGDGTVLDHSLILYGTTMGNSNQNQHFDVGSFLVGGANGALKGGRHLAYPMRSTTTGNLLLSILNLFGARQESQGDSTGPLAGLIA